MVSIFPHQGNKLIILPASELVRWPSGMGVKRSEILPGEPPVSQKISPWL